MVPTSEVPFLPQKSGTTGKNGSSNGNSKENCLWKMASMITLKTDEYEDGSPNLLCECEARRNPSKSGHYGRKNAGTEEDSRFCALGRSLREVRQPKAVLGLFGQCVSR